MATTLVRIDNSVYKQLMDVKPEYLSMTGFLSLTVQNALTDPPSLGGNPGGVQKNLVQQAVPAVDVQPKVEPKNKEKAPKQKKPKNIQPSEQDVPMELIDSHGTALVEWWYHRKSGAAQTDRSWTLHMNMALRINKELGADVLSKHVEEATGKRWMALDIELARKHAPGGAKGNEPEMKHPAHQVFKAQPVLDEPTTNDVLKDLF